MIISPAMLHEHLPYVVMEGLNKVSPWAALGANASFEPAVPCEPYLCPHVIGKGVDAQRSEPESPAGSQWGQRAHSCPGLHTPAPSTSPRGPRGREEFRRLPWTCVRGKLNSEGLKATWHLIDVQPGRACLWPS